MSSSSLFDVKTQLKFYGAYHSNPINVAIHVVCVPIILWSAQVMLCWVPVPSAIPAAQYHINDYLNFDLNWASILVAVYLAYYFVLEPVAAFLYTPQMILSLLTATTYARGGPNHTQTTLLLHGIAWILQFIGHGAAEKRAPALLDNLVGAVVLAPFFVHMEILFKLGYRPHFQKQLNNEIGVEIARIRKIEGDKRRAKAAKAQ